MGTRHLHQYHEAMQSAAAPAPADRRFRGLMGVGFCLPLVLGLAALAAKALGY